MEIEIVRVRAKLWQQERKLLVGQGFFLSFCARAKAAAQIADVGNFQINFVKSFHRH